ncbi:MAG: tRNA(Ile)(2)-agmatinylcytidine synthase [Methanomassiliicoccaceae archaeon]|nr:tRNA(Ile)(2)-agmatinylcytidine synthase [Methanomassiliicoccaceae archaeon]
MYVAVDDTDSVSGGCTTFLATEIISELCRDMDMIGYPRIVRLNPAVPWKTRGNGALAMRFGKGRGERILAGSIAGEDVFCYGGAAPGEPDATLLLERLAPIVERNSEPGSDAGLLVSGRKPPQSLYWRGVRTILGKGHVDGEVERTGALKREWGCGRGIIGAACGMAWRPRDSTLEVLAYRHRERWGTERGFDPLSIRDVDRALPSTFNSWEERTGKVAMVPSTPCPVLYGLRGDDARDLMRGKDMIRCEPVERWMTFLTNQGTDDHISSRFPGLAPNRSYYVEGKVAGGGRAAGGHAFMELDTSWGALTVGAYEPSKEFRYLFDNLSPGDVVGVMGELRDEPRTLNAEKVRVISVADRYDKVSNPSCPGCGRAMESVGRGKGYRCRGCRESAPAPVVRKAARWVREGWYEPPEAARRHLSKPLRRMGEEQPLGFVKRRI